MHQIPIARYVGVLPMHSAMPHTNRPLAECRKLHSNAEKSHV